MKNRVITISREFGSGRRTIGEMTTKKRGFHAIDVEIIRKIG